MSPIKEKIGNFFLSILTLLILLWSFTSAQEGYVPGRVVVEFQAGVINLPQGEYIVPINDTTVLNLQVLAALQSINAYEAEKLFKSAVPGQTEILSPITGQIVHIKDLSQYFIIRFDEEESVGNAVTLLSNLSEVISAAPDFYPVEDELPNDFYFDQQYYLENTVNSKFDIDASRAWDFSKGDNIKIAFIESGVRDDHPDLHDHIYYGTGSEIGYDTTNSEGTHGTYVAGVAAAVTNNNIGVAGVGWNSLIVPRIGAYLSDRADDIRLSAQEAGAHVINMSWHVSPYNLDPPYLRNAVRDAFNIGAVLTASMGNDSISGVLIYPAAYDSFVVACGALEKVNNGDSLQYASFQNSGPFLDVTAPGEDIWTTSPLFSEMYINLDGTSFSTPIVSGVIALLRFRFPDRTNIEIMDIIRNSSVLFNGWENDFNHYGHGMVSAYQAILLGYAYDNQSITDKATFSNNSRKLVKGVGYLHEIFASGGEIFFRRSANNGQSWGNTLRVSNGNYESGENGNPCIAYLETTSGETTQKTLFAVWERQVSSTQYEVWVSLSNVPDAATLTWSDPELLATVNISSSQSGAMPVISYLDYQGQKRLVVVYCSSQGLKYQVSDDLGSNWSSPTLISTEYLVRYPSVTTGGNFLSLVYDYFDHSNGTYSRIYNGSTWSDETHTSGTTGTIYNSTPSVTVDPHEYVLAVWKGQIWKGGEDPYTSIVFRKGFPNNTWDRWFEVFEHEPGISSVSPSISYFDYNGEYGIKIVYGNTADIVKQYVYDGSSWSQPDISFPGRWPSISEESSGSGNPVFFWTNPEGPPYLVELSDDGEESLSKYTPSHTNPLENISLPHHRRAVIRDQQSGAFLAVDVNPLIIKNAAGEETTLPFKAHSLKIPLNISLQNLGDYLGTDTLGLANDVQNLRLNWSASVFVDEDSSGNANPNIFNGKYQVHLRIKDVNNPAISTTVNITAIPQVNLNIGNFAGRSVVIRPEILLNNLPVANLDFGVGNVYSPVSPSQNKVLTQSGSDLENKTFALKSNYPNPFNPTTTIHYQVARESKVTLTIYNLLGQKVKTLVSEKIAAGDHYVAWDGRNDHGEIAGSGIYFLKMVAQSGEKRFVGTQKLMLMK